MHRMSFKDILVEDLDYGVRRWDRARWISVFSSHNPTIREVTECLGLGLSASSSTTNRGIPKFDNPDYRKLSNDITKLSKELPKERDVLLDFAADPRSLEKELEELLNTYGPDIWSRYADRTCLLKPNIWSKTYYDDLFYDVEEHREIIKIHMHRWIIIKACYYIRNMKLKRPSGANEYDSLAEMDGEGHSTQGTPHSLTPPERGASLGADFSVKPVNVKKRKSSTHLSLSDSENAYPTKRAHNTLPISRNGSPKKALKSIYPAGPTNLERPLLLPSPAPNVLPSPIAVSEPSRVQTSSCSGTELNGAANSAGSNQSPAPTKLTPISTVGFTAVNNTLSDREPLREAPHAAAKERQEDTSRNGTKAMPQYTSPYEPAPRLAEIAPRPIEPRPVPLTKETLPSIQGTRPSSSGHITNGVSHTSIWQPPSMKHAQHTHAAPQPQSLPPPPSHSKNAIYSNSQSHTSAYGYASASSYSQVHSHHLPARSNSQTNSSGPVIGRPIAPQPPSRTGSPLTQVTNNQSMQASETHQISESSVHSAPKYGIQLVPTQERTASSRDHRASVVETTHSPTQYQYSHQPVLKSHGADHAQNAPAPPAGQQKTPLSAHDIRLLQCEVTAGLITFFYPRSASPPDESPLLQRLHTLWYHGEALFRPELDSNFDLVSKILTSWIHERQAITALRHSLASQPGLNYIGLVDRLLAMNDLRVMRLKWKNMSTVDGLSPEDLLCQAFRVMTSTEGSEALFKEGLERLNNNLFEFLRSEDAKIVMQRR